MKKKTKLFLIIFLFLNLANMTSAKDNLFEEGEKKYIEKKYDEAKFLFQRNIVFNPKNAGSYLYLAKIFNFEKNEKEEEKNLNTTVLLEPENEEAILMLMEISLKKSNYSKVKDLSKTFSRICNKLCKKNEEILNSLKNIEPKNES